MYLVFFHRDAPHLQAGLEYLPDGYPIYKQLGDSYYAVKSCAFSWLVPASGNEPLDTAFVEIFGKKFVGLL